MNAAAVVYEGRDGEGLSREFSRELIPKNDQEQKNIHRSLF